MPNVGISSSQAVAELIKRRNINRTGEIADLNSRLEAEDN